MRPDLWLNLLDEHGPLLAQELDELVPEEEWDAQEPLPEDLLPIHYELFVRRSWLLDKPLTHRLTQAEVDAGMVAVLPDWAAPLDLIDDADDDVALVGGGILEILGPWRPASREVPDALADEEILFAFEPDYFTSRGMAEGDLVGLSLDAAGQARVEPVTVMSPSLVLDIDPEQATDASFMMWGFASAGLLDVPRPPVKQMAAEQGLHVRGGLIYPAGYPFALRWFELCLGRLSERYNLDLHEPVACAALLTRAEFPDATLEDIGVTREQFQASLAQSYEARVIAWEMLRRGRDPVAILAALQSMGPFAGDARTSVRYLEARFAELGAVLSAREMMTQIFIDDPDWPPAILALASYAQSAGDAQRAADLLELLEGTEARVAKLRSFLNDGATGVGRNDKCPCGSGRKYKQCHLGKPMMSIQQRVDWVIEAALQFVFDTFPGQIETLLSAVEARVEDVDVTALICDVALMECGLLAIYRESHGPLMPDADRDLIDSWLAAPPRTLVEVLDNTPGAMRVRDVVTGDELVVSERTAAPHMRPTSFWVSRIAPVGEQLQFFGGVYPVALHQREAVLGWITSPDSSESGSLLALMAQNLAGPQLQTSTGEDLMFCTALVKVAGSVSALDEALTAVGKQWLLTVDDTVHASVTRAGSNLKVETMSVERLDAALEVILEALPGSEILDISQRRPKERGSALQEALLPDEVRAQMPEEQKAFLTQRTRDYEREWLDLDIPALGGLTPRQAAVDPTRRDDLIRLLASFGESDDPMQMSPARLRELLGL